MKAQDSFVEANRELLLQRSEIGVKKYNTTLDKSKQNTKEFAQHAIEEALDLANYLQVVRSKMVAKEGLVSLAVTQCVTLDRLASTLVDQEHYEVGCAIRDQVEAILETIKSIGAL